MVNRKASSPSPRTSSLWGPHDALPWEDYFLVVESVKDRLSDYRSRPLDESIADCDDMYDGSIDGRAHYFNVGWSAIALVSEAMLIGRKTKISTVLDMPCGGGRVTRHLKTFYPEAALWASDIDDAKVTFVCNQFGASKLHVRPDFEQAPTQTFDLIFVGSLLTHFDEELFHKAMDFIIASLNEAGIAIVTLHGRYSAEIMRRMELAVGRSRRKQRLLAKIKGQEKIIENALEAIDGPYSEQRFGYTEYPSYSNLYGQSYGGCYSAPSWVIKSVEWRTDIHLLSYKERAFDNNQDTIILQKYSH